MKQVVRVFYFALVCLLCVASPAWAQTTTPTPDPFVTQITATSVDSFARDISGDGRFVVIESVGNIATQNANNADGNREIFLFDYAQRRVFQITNTRSALVSNTASSTLGTNIAVEVANVHAALSRDGRYIVFSSNAPTPGNFNLDLSDANRAALQADGNTEIFLYRIPDVPAADLSAGLDPGLTNLSAGTFMRLTNTPASRLPSVGTATSGPFIADDNRDASINDDGSRIAFVSTRNTATSPIAGNLTNADANPELFAYNRVANTYAQLTDTTGAFVFNENPSISGTATGDSIIAFVSNANIAEGGAANNADANSEVYFARYNGAANTQTRQVTRTRTSSAGFLVNTFSPGHRVSRDGALIAFESNAADPGANADTTLNGQTGDTIFVYNVAANAGGGTPTFTAFAPRPATGEAEVANRFPTFTGDSTRLVFTSALNILPDGTRGDAAAVAGLNPNRRTQIFSAAVTGGSTSFSLLTNTPAASGGASPQAFPSDTVRRVAFSFSTVEFGTGNADGTSEAYYLNVPATATANATPTLAFFTGASLRGVAAPSASPTPTPSPVPATAPGLSPGELAVVRTTDAAGATLAPAAVTVGCMPNAQNCANVASESGRRPSLPVELGGVSVSVNGAAAGLYFVSPNEIQFVVPPALAASTSSGYPVVVTIREGNAVRTVRSALVVVAAQPDLLLRDAAANRALITNITNPLLAMGTFEPFTVMTTYTDGTTNQPVTARTVLRAMLTGVRGVTRSQVTVRLVRADNTNIDITGADIISDAVATDLPGIYQLDFRLPDAAAAVGDVRVVIIVTNASATFSSRATDTAPLIRIN